MAPDALWFGLIQLALGIITIVVSLGLLRGSNGARIVVTVVFVLNLISAVFVIFFQQAQVWSGIVSGVLVLIGLVLLWTRQANEFFRRLIGRWAQSAGASSSGTKRTASGPRPRTPSK